MEQPHLHEIIRPIKELARMAGERIIELVVPGDVFDDFLADSPLDTPRPGEIGSVPTQPTLWD